MSTRREQVLVAALLLAACQHPRETPVVEPASSREAKGPQTSASAELADSTPSRVSRTDTPQPPVLAEEYHQSSEVLWCASGGAPVVGQPVFDEQERVYVATSDGYLHAFERDGRYRWSYTVKGTPLGSVSLRPHDGVILMGTTASLVYAISQSGTLYWRFSTTTPVWSGLLAMNSQTVVFLGLDERLYALANTGRARYRVRAPGTPMGGPVVAPGDVVWVPLANGVARFKAAYQLQHFPLPSPAEQLIDLGDQAIVRAGGRAYRIESGEEPIDLGPAESLAGDGRRVLVLANEGHHQSLMAENLRKSIPASEPENKKESMVFALPELSDAPALSQGRLWMPEKTGRLRIRQLGSGKEAVIRVGESELKTPLVSASGERAVLSDYLGRFCVVDLSGSKKFADE